MDFLPLDTYVPESQGVQAWDRYAYSNNNPIRYSDPSGHFACGDGIDDPRCEQYEQRGAGVQSTQGNNPSSDLIDIVVSGLSWASVSADYSALVLSDVEAAVSDMFVIGFTAVGCGGGGAFGPVTIPAGCGVGALAGLSVDMWISSGSPLGTAENLLGAGALGATLISDALVGNTQFDPIKGDLRIGKDTIVSGRNFFFGLVPESNLDAWISTSQVKYDTDRLQGIKPGGSYNLVEGWKPNGSGFLGAGLHFYFFDWW